MNARSSTVPAGARDSHFDDTHVHAVIRSVLCRRATTKPLPASGCLTSTRRHASATLAVDTYGTVAQTFEALVVDRPEQRCADVRRRGENDARRFETLAASADEPSRALAPDACRRRLEQQRSRGQPVLDRVDELRHPASQALGTARRRMRVARRFAARRRAAARPP